MFSTWSNHWATPAQERWEEMSIINLPDKLRGQSQTIACPNHLVVGEIIRKIVTERIKAPNLVQVFLGWPSNILEGVTKKISNRKWIIDKFQNGRLYSWTSTPKTPKQSYKNIKFGMPVHWVIKRDPRRVPWKKFKQEVNYWQNPKWPPIFLDIDSEDT